MSGSDKTFDLDSATWLAAGLGGIAAGSVAYLLSRSTGASPASEAGTTLLGGLLGAAAVVVTKRSFLSSESDERPHEGSEANDLPHPNSPEVLEAVRYLQEKVGTEVTAYLSGAEDVQTIERWSSRSEIPEPAMAGRLLYGYETIRPIVDRYDVTTAKAWLFGTNPWLRDEAPAYVLRHADQPSTWEQVVHAGQDCAELKR